MLGQPRVVGIIVNYNAGDWLLRSVQALATSTIPISIYVVDNHSTDESITALKRTQADIPGLRIIENDDNRGFAAANNQVLANVDGDYYVLVNPDCEVQPQTIEAVIEAMQRVPRIGLASCVIRDSDGQVQKTCRRRFPTPWSSFVRLLGLHRVFPRLQMFDDFDLGRQAVSGQLEEVEAVSGAFMVVRRQAVRTTGLLDEGYFMHCEDLDWCMRFWKAGYKVAFVPDVEVIHAKGISGRSDPWRVNWYLHKGMIRFYQKFYKEKYPLPLMWLVYIGVSVRFLVKGSTSAMSALLTPSGTKSP